ncbi:MAG: hypothetical protein HQL95_10055, partial [Magnetococcales bacterium]|nr:hypothetical protein [Magnetococcales bacterium]
MRLSQYTLLAVMAGLLALASGPVRGQESSEEPKAAPVAAASSIESSITLGAGHLFGDRQQLGIFDARDHARWELLLDANLVRRDEETGTWN